MSGEIKYTVMKRTVALLLVLVFACIQVTGIFHHHEPQKRELAVDQKTAPSTSHTTYTASQSCKLCDLLSQHYHQYANFLPLSGALNPDLIAQKARMPSLLMPEVTCAGFSNKGPPSI